MVNITLVDINTGVMLPLVGLLGMNLIHGIIPQWKDMVIQGKLKLGKYRYLGKVTTGRIIKGKIYQGIIAHVRIC